MTLSQDDFDYIRELVRQHTGICLQPNLTTKIKFCLTSVAKEVGFPSVAQLVANLRIQSFNWLHRYVVESVLVPETSFFRDVYPFEALKNFVLPELLKNQLTTSQRHLNIWSAACSSGQEVYSIALLLRQNFPIFCHPGTLQLFASDVSNDILNHARAGCYSAAEVKRGLPIVMLQRYFQPINDQWKVKQEIRRLIEFRQINLADAWPMMPKMDIIFMRNVLIYFDIPTQKAILEKVQQQLQPQGYLFLGVGETPLTLNRNFEPVQFEKARFYRVIGNW